MAKIKVLVVEDSLVFQRLLAGVLAADPMIEVVATAGDPYEARDAIIEYRPDVMTLDIELPRMGGLEFLRKLMPQFPLPTVVISSLSDKVFDALQAGAVDFVAKPVGANREQLENFVKNELVTKIKIASTVRVEQLRRPRHELNHKHNAFMSTKTKLIAMGASTGGTEALCDVISGLEGDIPGIVVVQHMPPGFTKMFAERLHKQSKLVVKEAEDGDRIVPGRVLIAPGDKQMRVRKVGAMYKVECKPGEKVSGHCPSVDVLFQSVAETAGKDTIGVILTGMGRDGASGLLAMRNKGAKTIGQDEASCVVYGMPKEAFLEGAVMYQENLENIAGRIYKLLES